MKNLKYIIGTYLFLILMIIAVLVYNITLGDLVGYSEYWSNSFFNGKLYVTLEKSGDFAYIIGIGYIVSFITIVVMLVQKFVFKIKIEKFKKINILINILLIYNILCAFSMLIGGTLFMELYRMSRANNILLYFNFYDHWLYPLGSYMCVRPTLLLALVGKVCVLYKNKIIN